MEDDDKQLSLFDTGANNSNSVKLQPKVKPDKSTPFSKYVVYVDESGDHGLQNIDDKNSLKKQSDIESNPYHMALGFCLEELYDFLVEKNQHEKKTHIVVECRGKKEDAELELSFRRVCDGRNRLGLTLPFEVIFSDKKVMSSGLQLADLVARPIGLSVLRPNQINRAFDALKKKFYCDGGRDHLGENYFGKGLKIYPLPDSEKPR
ncbi:hypothetical protein MNBD_GAMMA02-1042 [hydrothermal vent metagenome]|uniref:DUF3800 domain-containing protein n=1 Tax=hydrothermal vent metagenome TaxID=652676 RepID=A0A3B0WGR5_9ZZZZ